MSFSMKYRRRRSGKTNYHKRLKLLQAGVPRFVVRRTNTAIICQFISYKPAGDTVLAQATSRDVLKEELTTSGKSVPASYLTGYLAAKRAAKAGVNEAVVDIGMFTATKGNRLFAAVKGALDAGIKLPVSEEILPSEERIQGKHISEQRNVTINVNDIKNKLKA